MSCLLCRQDAVAKKNTPNLTSVSASLCCIFGLPDKHPLKVIFANSQYCDVCLKELQDADMALGRLELLRQNLLRFQNKVYSKLGNNYFQIKDKDELEITPAEFEEKGKQLQGRKFTYNEVIKIVYEKLDALSFKWERFSSETKCDISTSNSNSTITKVDACTETTSPDLVDAETETNDYTFEVEPPFDKVITITATTSEAELSSLNMDESQDADADTTWDNQTDRDNMDESSLDDPCDSEIQCSDTTSMLDLTSSSVSDLSPLKKTNIDFQNKLYCPFDPDNCNKIFYDDYNLQIHIRSFHEGNPRPYQCAQCRKEFIDETHLKSHNARMHTRCGNYICEQCGKGFGAQTLLRDHIRKVHEKSEIRNCYFCSAPFTCTKALTNHEELHRKKENPFDCLFCDESGFSNSTSLKSHYSVSHAKGKFMCDLCNRVLANENGLRLHRVTHTEAFKCDQCSFTGSSQSSLNSHRLSHSNLKPFTCEVCGASYKYAKNLVAHSRVHTGEKPFLCKICGLCFRERSYLNRHEESHAVKLNYQCHVCSKKFKVQENLKKHVRLHNGYKKIPKSPPKTKRNTKNTQPESPGKNKRKIKPKRKSKLVSKSPKQRSKSPPKPKRQKSPKVQNNDRKIYENVVCEEIIEIEKFETFEMDGEITEEIITTDGAFQQPTTITVSHPMGNTIVYTSSAVFPSHFQPTTINVPSIGPVTVIPAQTVTIDETSSCEIGYNLS